jgi:hypothetical protein
MPRVALGPPGVTAYYDGRASAAENYEERTGVAVGAEPAALTATSPPGAGPARRDASTCRRDAGTPGRGGQPSPAETGRRRQPKHDAVDTTRRLEDR